MDGKLRWLCGAVLALSAVGQTGCLTQQTVRTKSSTISFKGYEDDSKKIRSKFGGGYRYSPTGEVISDRKSPYDTDKMLSGSDRLANSKVFRNGRKDYAGNEYKTPDYLARNQDYRTKKAWGGEKAAAESDMSRHLAAGADTEAKTRDAKGLNRLFRTRDASGTSREFATHDPSRLVRAQENAPSPEPIPGPSAENGYRIEKRATRDEIRQLLHPGQGGGS